MSLTTLHEVATALQSYLSEHGCPLDVIDGPINPTTTWASERIVIEYDDDAKGSFANPRGLHTNAKHRYTATDPIKVTIYAQSKRTGGLTFEHRARAMLIRETVIAGLEYVAAVNKNKFLPKTGGFVTPPDLAKTETQPGAVYELKITYDLPIRAVTFVGAARPEGSVVDMRSTTRVGRNGIADDDDDPNTPQLGAETACGA